MPSQSNQVGTLYVVATPIGNLQDITLRAIEILKRVDRIAAEDTRHAAGLLKHFSIQKPMFSLHDFNERKQVEKILSFLKAGESIALISDAGTPLISDPGFYLVRELKQLGIQIVPIPGACAAITALSASGLPTDQFIFAGFLSAKSQARKEQLMALEYAESTLVFYEAPHRLLASLESMSEVFGKDRQAVVARELTKIHESFVTASLQDVIQHFKTHSDEQRGEMVILIAGLKEKPTSSAMMAENVLNILLEELPLKQAVSLASKITQERKNILYEMALAKKSK